MTQQRGIAYVAEVRELIASTAREIAIDTSEGKHDVTIQIKSNQ